MSPGKILGTKICPEELVWNINHFVPRPPLGKFSERNCVLRSSYGLSTVFFPDRLEKVSEKLSGGVGLEHEPCFSKLEQLVNAAGPSNHCFFITRTIKQWAVSDIFCCSVPIHVVWPLLARPSFGILLSLQNQSKHHSTRSA